VRQVGYLQGVFKKSSHQNPFAHYFTIFDLLFEQRVKSKRLRRAWKVVTTENISNTHTHIPCPQRMLIENFKIFLNSQFPLT